MKKLMSLVGILVITLLVGCAKKQEVDTGKLEASFSTAEPTTKGEVDKAVAAVKSQDWAGATASLKKLAADAKLTEAQKQAVKDTMDSIGNKIKEAAGKVSDEANKALGEAQKSLGK
jgi:type IV pilus biogenesis protein CpaD/CtpE